MSTIILTGRRPRRMAPALARIAAFRPEISVEALALSASVFFSIASNQTFFRAAAATGALDGAGGLLTFASLFVAITALHAMLL